ncbi:M23 family peptidase [Sphingomonas sp. HMWF008]|nr:M23 family peptidase [Sphingomonas sp. HMWF008]
MGKSNLFLIVVALAAPVAARPLGRETARAIRLSSSFGTRIDPLIGATAMHRGIDLAGPAGTPILAAAAGVIRFAGPRGGYGNFIEIAHPDGSLTRYGHLGRLLVSTGATVDQGSILGLMGSTGRSTGSHLHFEYLLGGVAVDPLSYLGSSPAQRPPPRSVPPSPRLQTTVPFRSAFARAREAAVAPTESAR